MPDRKLPPLACRDDVRTPGSEASDAGRWTMSRRHQESSTGRTVVGYAVLKSIHLFGVVVWGGGMFFALACLRPAAAALEPVTRVGLMRDALGRFLNIVVVAAGLVLV